MGCLRMLDWQCSRIWAHAFLENFMDFLAPPQPDFDIDATMKTLNSDPAVITASGWWTAFDKEPTSQSSREDAVFKPLPDIFKKVVDAIIMNSNSKLTKQDCSIDFLQNSNMATMSADRHTQSGLMVIWC
jgi:hypothetical protein